MLSKLFRKITDLSPRFSRWTWRIFYEFLGMYSKKMFSWKYMNYGYANAGTSGFESLDACSENLYIYLCKLAELSGKQVLEVGCGRGGGCELMLQFDPEVVTGVDFSKSNIHFCKKRYKKDKQLAFIAGDAEDLPFDDNHFDVLINVESSHCYGNRDQFFKEAYRVLKPGGVFLYADFMGRVYYPKRTSALKTTGFNVTFEKDITGNVLLAMQLSAPFKETLVKNKVPKPFRKAINDFTGTPGSTIFKYFESREGIYFAMVCQKPQDTTG